jgi:hypothetical protein
LDESGNFDFSSKGSKYFTLTSVAMLRPFEMAYPLNALKYDLIENEELEETRDGEYFHASEDRQSVRNKVFSIIKKNISKIQIDSLIVEKRKTMTPLQSVHKFYPEMLRYLLKYPLNRIILKDYGVGEFMGVIFITDSLPINKNKRSVEKSIKLAVKSFLPKTPYKIFHHLSQSSMELQIVDYCSWAIFKKWERGDTRSYDLIKEGVRSEFDIFERGSNYYY